MVLSNICKLITGSVSSRIGTNTIFGRFYVVSYSSKPLPPSLEDEESCSELVTDKEHKTRHLQVWQGEPKFPELIFETEKKEVGFWKSDKGLQVKDKLWTGLGRVLRMALTIERYNNAWETSVSYRRFQPDNLNKFDKIVYEKHGPEWSAGYLVFKLGGALKLVTDDRWIDDVKLIRTPKKKDFTIQAIDLRASMVNYVGLYHLARLGFVRYLNFADCPNFCNACMTRLHPVADTLEYLDVSGTKVTTEGFSYFRVFPNLKWLNISRLRNPSNVEALLPFLLEILPYGCVVVFNDHRNSLSYGSPIPFRDPGTPSKDHLVAGNCGIGDVTVFERTHGENSLQLQDMSSVYELWQTPKISRKRKMFISHGTPRESFLGNVAKYVKKAESYPPLL